MPFPEQATIAVSMKELTKIWAALRLIGARAGATTFKDLFAMQPGRPECELALKRGTGLNCLCSRAAIGKPRGSRRDI
jgi:hypothetical protein